MGIQKQILHVIGLNKPQVDAQEVGEEESQVVDELLVVVRRVFVSCLDISVGRDHPVDRSHDTSKHVDELGVVIVRNVESANLGQTLEGRVPKLERIQELGHQHVDQGSLEDEPKGDPIQEPQEGLQGRLDQARLVGLFEHLAAQLENLGKFAAHLVLQVFSLGLSHLFGRIVEDLLR